MSCWTAAVWYEGGLKHSLRADASSRPCAAERARIRLETDREAVSTQRSRSRITLERTRARFRPRGECGTSRR
eukprot:679452-Heterocapsa_arctica.AAC.1